MPDTVNPELTAIQEAFKATVWNNAITALKTAIYTAVPALNIPVLSSIVSGVINLFAGKLYKYLVLQVDIGAIRLTNTRYHYEYVQASKKLLAIANNQGIESDEFKKARDEAAIALSHFTRINQ